MDTEAPYLQAIQAIAGRTPGEKGSTLNLIARELAKIESSDDGDSLETNPQYQAIPDLLKPLVRVKVANILRRHEGIIEALKSKDWTVLSCALRARWFFCGSEIYFPTPQYLSETLFASTAPYVRSLIVRRFGIYLKDSEVAANFFLAFGQRYGFHEAAPLLLACDEEFGFNMISEKLIVLPPRMVAPMYRKYPNMIIKYLMLAECDGDSKKNLHHVNIGDYENFLPEIAKKRLNDFIEIYKLGEFPKMKLDRKAAELFVKTRLELLIEKPIKYLNLVPLKSVCGVLSSEDFTKMFTNLFPENEDDFDFGDFYARLENYEPLREKLATMILDTYRQVYGSSIPSSKFATTPVMLRKLPAVERIKLARLMLKENRMWYPAYCHYSWRCYLPISESLPEIFDKMARTVDSKESGQFAMHAVYTCQVNDDKNALLKVLNYVFDNYRKDARYEVFTFLGIVCECFDVSELGLTFWQVFDKYIKLAEEENDLTCEGAVFLKLLEAALRRCSLNNYNFDGYLSSFVNARIKTYGGSWNICIGDRKMERQFLVVFLEFISKEYPIRSHIWKENELHMIMNLTSSMWEYNKRYEISDDDVHRLSIKQDPWFLDTFKAHILDETSENKYWIIVTIIPLLRTYERDLYDLWIRSHSKFWLFGPRAILDVLIMEPQRVIDAWKDCVEKVQEIVLCNEDAALFIRRSRWYRHLPIQFYNHSLKTREEKEKRDGSLKTLKLLTEHRKNPKLVKSSVSD